MTKTLTEGQIELVNKAEKALIMLGVAYAIKMPDGTVRGDVEAVAKKPKQPLRFRRGEIKAYVDGYLKEIAVGDKVLIPIDKYGMDSIQSSACMYMTEKHGKDMYSTTRNLDAEAVEVHFDCGL